MWRELLLLLFILLLFVTITYLEHFQGYLNPEGSRFRCPTRNMSYDLRGDVPIIPQEVGMMNQSTVGPEDPYACSFRKSIFI